MYIKVKSKWIYLYRAVDKGGDTIDFYFSTTRNAKATKLFLGKALVQRQEWERVRVINTDKAAAYGVSIQELKVAGKLPEDTEHHQMKDLNNVVEAYHCKLKQFIKPILGFKSVKTAYATIKGFKAIRTLKKGQSRDFQFQEGTRGEVRLVDRCFHIGGCALVEVMKMASLHLENQAS